LDDGLEFDSDPVVAEIIREAEYSGIRDVIAPPAHVMIETFERAAAGAARAWDPCSHLHGAYGGKKPIVVVYASRFCRQYFPLKERLFCEDSAGLCEEFIGHRGVSE